MRSMRRAISYLAPYWLIALGAVVSLVLVTAANLIIPQLIRWVIDEGITLGNMKIILQGAIGLVGIAAVRGLFNFTQGYWSEKASQNVAFDVRNDLFNKIQSLSFSYHDQAQTGQLMTRLTSDVEQLRQFTGMGLFQFINALIMLFGSAAFLLIMNWQLALIAMGTIPLLTIFLVRFMLSIRPLFEQVQARLGVLNTTLQENLAGVRVVKAFAREEFEANRFHAANQGYLSINLATVRAFASNFPSFFFVFNLGTLGIVWVGGLMTISGNLTLGELAAFMTYLNFMIFPMMMLGMLGAMIARAVASERRIFEILDAQSEVIDRPGAILLPPIKGRVAFEEVTFRYVAAEQDTLSHVSFIAEPGQTIAILGATGAGKSTVINLIPRFYDVTGGRVTLDDYDVRDVTLDSLRSQIGIVLQETTLFSGTIRDNIAYGRPDASDEAVIEAAKAAQAHDFIVEMEDGYQTRVGERGLGLSGGQRQRIAIARALLLDPRILILDDSTSSVDAETEYQLQQALDRLMVGRTSFVIAQRISTVRNADLILVLDHGQLAAMGTHEDLLTESSLYAEILYSQLREDTQALKVA